MSAVCRNLWYVFDSVSRNKPMKFNRRRTGRKQIERIRKALSIPQRLKGFHGWAESAERYEYRRRVFDFAPALT